MPPTGTQLSSRHDTVLFNGWLRTAMVCLALSHSANAVDPPGDHLESPYMMAQPYGSLIVDSAVTATSQPTEPLAGTGHTVWFRWTAPGNGPVAFDTLSGFFPTVIKAYAGTSLATLVPMPALPDPGPAAPRTNRVRFQATAGQSYSIQVDATTATRGRFILKWWQGAPANDAFANASWVDSGVYFFSLSSVNATKEPGEPNHAGNPGGRSVWIPYTAEMSRGLAISTEGSDFDTLLAVYTGDSLATLTEVESSDDHDGNRWSRVHFDAVRDQQYWIVIDGSGGDGGSIFLDIRYDLIEPYFTGIRRVNSSQLELSMVCNDTRRFQIESTTDMITWAPWATTPESEHGELRVAIPAGFDTSSRRFFRAYQLRDND